MKKIYYILPLAAATVLMSASYAGSEEGSDDGVKFDIANMDQSVAPGASFFDYATGSWAKANPIPADRSRYGSFDKLAEQNQKQVKSIIEELGQTTHEQGSIGQKIGDLYALGMDTIKLKADGANPIKAQLSEINRASNQEDIIKLVGKMRQYASTPFFGFYVGSDAKDSDQTLIKLYQTGLGLGNRDYYLEEDETSVALRKGYVELITKQFQNAGYPLADAKSASEVILRIETTLAKSHITKEDLRQPEKNYNKIKVSQLNEVVAPFNWNLFFESAGAKGFDEINVGQHAPITEAVRLIKETPIDETKTYLSWCLIRASASYLSDDFIDANFDFYGRQMTGRKEQQPRWKRTVNTVDDVLSEAVGQIYVQKYFPAEAKERMKTLVSNLQSALGERISNLTWMSNTTKARAQEKLNSFTVKIGYPDTWIDYSSLKIEKDSYWANIVRAKEFEFARMLDKIGKPVDKTEWHMPPQMVNAYYNPTTNEICFPAGILQAPFFYLDADDAVNYGAIGVVIGHEMSHGFDDQGCKYDKDGNMNNWWTDADSKKFTERAQVLVDHFSGIEVLPGLNANGKFTLGENIGDFGGLKIAYSAFEKTQQAKSGEKMDGFTPQQRFFLSYSNVWAGSIRDEEVRRLTKIDPHSLGRWRVDGMLPHIGAWYEAFNITESDPLFLPKEKRADIW